MNSRPSFVKWSGFILVAGFLLIGTFASTNARPLAQGTPAVTSAATSAPTMAATPAVTSAATTAATTAATVVVTPTTSSSGGGTAPSATPVPPTNTALPPAEASASTGQSETAKCVPAEVAVFVKAPRIHVKCASPTNGILYFATGTADAATAQRVLTVLTSALVSGKALSIVYDPSDLSGAAIGCLNTDCRLIVTVSIVP